MTEATGQAAQIADRLLSAETRLDAHTKDLFRLRFQRSEADLFEPLEALYGGSPGYAGFREDLIAALIDLQAERPPALRHLDLRRDLEPDWFQRPGMVGYVFYIDRFAGTLRGVLDKAGYLEELGVTYVHFMPCLKPRPGDSDGGYSVMDYRAVNPALGSMDDLAAVTTALRERGMSVCIDLVLNHTAKEHEWAMRARRGETAYQDYYWMFDDRTRPDAYDETLLEIFPAHAPGNFTWYEDMQKWVWTTFNEHQWDLNWSNPRVFLEIVKIMLFLANQGVEAVRLDAVAFMWKRMGTNCQNQPEVHQLLQALRAASRIVAPALLHKEEAIVAPKDLIPYLGAGKHTGKEGNLAYHNSLMVQFWSALATRETKLMTHVLRSHFPESLVNATWGTYLRCHDDIGWAVTDEDAAAVGINGFAHRSFLADFFAGRFPGSYARGGDFQSNPGTGDKRTNGSCASLCGLESALAANDEATIAAAIHRILMGHALIASFGGIPLLYMGDELGVLNDHAFEADEHLKHDGRWMHRPKMDWTQAERRNDITTIEGRIYRGLHTIIERRCATPHIHAANPVSIVDFGIAGVFAFARRSPVGALVCVFNFSERWQSIPRTTLKAAGVTEWRDRLANVTVDLHDGALPFPPQGRIWLT
ncbi:alpha-amylase family glycosyl hydrolase [Aestuariivirga sp.]|uniref:alpha-amylase family glycosyl hydrolase n=1 Tax=Aestuariivirga sp. TaxID=2650926 RepID=UPI003593F154